MPVINRIADMSADMTAWRRHLHTIPELGCDCPKTAAFVAERLREFGVDEMHEGIAQTGIVAIIEGQGDGPDHRAARRFRCAADHRRDRR